MATSAMDFSSLQPSDYGASDVSLQDYSSIDNSGLAAPATDSTDAFGFPSPPPVLAPTADASGGLNAYDPGLLPLTNPNPYILDSLGSGSDTSFGISSGGNDLSLPENLPLTPATSSIDTQLSNNAPIVSPNILSARMGSNLFGSIFGVGAAAAAGAIKSGVAGTPAKSSLPGSIATATKPISAPTSATAILTIGVAASLVGMIIWSVMHR